MQNTNQDPIFKEEQEHLSNLYDHLVKMEGILEEELKSLEKDASDEKNTVSDDLNYNFNNIEDSQETLIEFETMSQAVAQLNISSKTVTSKLRSVRRLLPRAYFARITLQFDEDEPEENFYIGTTAISDQHKDPLVIDWRSPIAEVYYNHENGATSYEVNGHRIPVDLKLRRQFDLEKNELKAYFDTKVALEDPMLIHSLTKKRTDKMQSITETIQKEQNDVIRHPDVPVLLVNGIAGSGKTSILLQRIAYLFYRKRQSLRANQVCLITLNPVFQQYIDHVLPEMGEMNPETMTWADFMDFLKVEHPGQTDMTDAEHLVRIDEKLSEIRLDNENFFKNLNIKRNHVFSKKQIVENIRRHKNTMASSWLVHTIAEELEEMAKKKQQNQEKQNQQEGITEDYFAEEETAQSQFGGVIDKIRNFEWIDFHAIGKYLLGVDELTPVEYVYLKMSLLSGNDCNTRYVIVDEVQDYSLAQIMVLKKYFKNAHFMFLGDEFQAIHYDTVRFQDIHELFESSGKEVVELPLLTSYRSSPEITKLFTGLLPEETGIRTNSIQRPGVEPEIKAVEDKTEFVKLLREVIKEQENQEGLTAVIVEDWTGINQMKRLLGEDVPHIIHNYEALPKSGVILMELKLAKGLEFDTVILPDVTEQNYPDEMLFRHRLYTAISRATEKLILLANGKLSPLIPS
ncbi:MAG TPA: DNA helicase [Oribacterium sp.]|nr:DNA helicase [Oribacterium sp.]